MKARYPAARGAGRGARRFPGKPGSYNAVAYLRPWLQMEELTTSLRMVARIPAAASVDRDRRSSHQARRPDGDTSVGAWPRHVRPRPPPAGIALDSRTGSSAVRDLAVACRTPVLSGALRRQRRWPPLSADRIRGVPRSAESGLRRRCDGCWFGAERGVRLPDRPAGVARRARSRHRRDRCDARRAGRCHPAPRRACASWRDAGAASPGWSAALDPAEPAEDQDPATSAGRKSAATSSAPSNSTRACCSSKVYEEEFGMPGRRAVWPAGGRPRSPPSPGARISAPTTSARWPRCPASPPRHSRRS